LETDYRPTQTIQEIYPVYQDNTPFGMLILRPRKTPIITRNTITNQSLNYKKPLQYPGRRGIILINSRPARGIFNAKDKNINTAYYAYSGFQL